jgi:NitT/TauT family transport system permease protein
MVQLSFKAKVRAIQIGFFVLFISIWEALPTLGFVESSLFPSFTTTVETGILLFTEDSIIGDLLATLFLICTTFVIVSPLAIVVGFYLGTRTSLREFFMPILNTGMGVPKSIFLPIFIIVLGTGSLQKIVFAFQYGFFVIVIVTMGAVSTVDKEILLAVRSMGASERELYRHVYFPAALPTIVTGLRIGLIFTVLGVIISEMYVSRAGVGKLIAEWGISFKIPELFAGVAIISVSTILMNEGMRSLERRVSKWEL